MALTYSKHIFHKTLLISNSRQILSILISNHPCSSSSEISENKSNQRVNRAMKAYLERIRKYNELMEEQLKEYNLGKKHLANIMGLDEEKMTANDINEAIQYLFPSKLYAPLARPLMRHPYEFYPPSKEAEYDYTGRPYHYLYYTCKPNFSQLLHDAAQKLEELNLYEKKMKSIGNSPQTMKFEGDWLSKNQLEEKLSERLYSSDYDKYIEVFERLSAHPYNYLAEEFIKSYKHLIVTVDNEVKPITLCNEDGSLFVEITNIRKKTAIGNVKVTYPGKGNIKINGVGLDYFLQIQPREQPANFVEISEKMPITNNDTSHVKIY